MLAGSPGAAREANEETFGILVGRKSNPDRLEPVMPIEEVTPRSMAIFEEVLLVGTEDGRVLRANLFGGDGS